MIVGQQQNKQQQMLLVGFYLRGTVVPNLKPSSLFMIVGQQQNKQQEMLLAGFYPLLRAILISAWKQSIHFFQCIIVLDTFKVTSKIKKGLIVNSYANFAHRFHLSVWIMCYWNKISSVCLCGESFTKWTFGGTKKSIGSDFSGIYHTTNFCNVISRFPCKVQPSYDFSIIDYHIPFPSSETKGTCIAFIVACAIEGPAYDT